MKKIKWVMNLIVCALLVSCYFKINDLENQVYNLMNSINNVDRHLSNDISSIYHNVQNMLDEESNQLTMSDWEYGDIHLENKTAKIIAYVIPKEYNSKTTQVKLVGKNETYVLDYKDGKYVAEIDVPLFEETNLDQVLLDDNGTIRTQKLDWSIIPRYEALLMTYAHYNGSTSGSRGDLEYTWKSKLTIDIDIEKDGIFDIKKIDVVEVLDGKEINRMNVDISASGQQAYAKQLAKKGESIPENLTEMDGFYSKHATFIYPYIKEVNIPNGSELVVFVDITDENDLTYRCVVNCIAVKSNGQLDEIKMDEYDMYSHFEAVMILDANGNVLYQVDDELFK